jgi:hypothetical protein
MQQQQQGTIAGILYLKRQKHHQQRELDNSGCMFTVSINIYARLRFYVTGGVGHLSETAGQKSEKKIVRLSDKIVDILATNFLTHLSEISNLG